MSVTVITASLPTRSAMLAECVASIAAQYRPPVAHLVAVDHARAGSSAMRNLLLGAVKTEWVGILDDDDIALPHHLAALAEPDADVVYSLPKVEGRSGWQPVGPFDPARLAIESYIPATSVIRTRFLDVIGGWRPSSQVEHGWEDWDLYKRLHAAGARFAFVPEITWRYRFHGGNKTNRGEGGAV
jgi:hypothetical protein